MRPNNQKKYAFSATCRSPACRNIAVNNRQNWPSATAMGCIAPRSNRSCGLGLNSACGPPRITSITNGIAIATSRALVALTPPRSAPPGATAEVAARLLDALGALVADRRGDHAVRADRAVAAGAVDARRHVRMPVAHLDRGRGGEGRWSSAMALILRVLRR